MKLVNDIAKMQELSLQARAADLTVAFVPTMGFLHEGHLDLVRRARELADVVVVSIFVNPTQFNRSDDFESYPSDLKTDQALLEAENTDILFMPSAKDVYPEGASTRVRVDGITEPMEGAFRPGHFEGVATVVSALFNMVQPNVAVFGEKDYQQLQSVRRMTADLHFPIRIVAGPTVREADGLAMSSRNARLNAEQRAAAPVIRRALQAAAQAFDEGCEAAAKLADLAREPLASCAGFALEYVELVNGETLEPVAEARPGCVIAVAGSFGDVRLIDNVILGRGDEKSSTHGRAAHLGATAADISDGRIESNA